MNSIPPLGAGSDVATALAPERTQSVIRAPKWLPFTIALSCMAVLLLIPQLLTVLAPIADDYPVGVLELVKLSASDDHESAIGGFIAPEGWSTAKLSDPSQDDGEEDAAEDPSTRTFVSPDHLESISVELLIDVSGVEELMRARAPIASSDEEIEAAKTQLDFPELEGFQLSAFDFMLGPGNASTQMITACAVAAPNVCMLVTSQTQTPLDDPRFEQRQSDGVVLPEVRSLLRTLEVYP